MQPSDEVYEALRSACLQWATPSSAEKGHDIKKEGGDRSAVAAGEWFEADPFQSTVPTVHVVRASIGMYSSTRKLPWSSH